MNYYYKIPKWDSLRLEILAERVRNKSHIGQEIIKSVKETGVLVEGDDESPLIEMSVSKNDDGIKYRFAKYNARVGVDTEERYQVLVNAKMLGAKYFEGINKDNVRDVYDYLISKNILEFSYDDFLDAKVFDCDCAYDFVSSAELLHGLCSRVKSLVLHEKERFVNQFTNKIQNVGLDLNRREGATIMSPFLKIYHKGLELDYRSYDFNKKYVKRNGLKIGRYEFTFKNRKHFNHFGVEVITLRDLLNIPVEVLRKMVLGNIRKYYLEKGKRMRNTEKLGPKAFYEKYLINFAIQKGMGREFFLACVKEYQGSAETPEDSQVWRLKRYIEQSLDDEFWNKKLEENSAVDELFNDFV